MQQSSGLWRESRMSNDSQTFARISEEVRRDPKARPHQVDSALGAIARVCARCREGRWALRLDARPSSSRPSALPILLL
jgi:hypothetical protein